MKHDILLCGVGGQGILSVAYVLDHSALESGFCLKQPEIHGMAQRGGAVQAHVRISDQPVASPLIPQGTADLILALEPMESLRYLRFLSSKGMLVADVTPFVNIPNYPETRKLYEVLFRLPSILAVNGAVLARKAGSPRAQNMVLLGAASAYLPFSQELVEKHISKLFSAKSERLVEINHKAFRMGKAAGTLYGSLVQAGASPSAVSRVLVALEFSEIDPSQETTDAWKQFFRDPDADNAAARLCDSGQTFPLDPNIPAQILNTGGPAPAKR
jgi:indolepyruvate ferredoxin oxidoreductase, beta subunit